MITEEQIKKVTNIIVINYKPEKIILFGSHANGDPTEDSDLDLLIIKDSHLPIRKRPREIRKHLRRLKISIDLLVYTPKEIEEWLNVRTAFTTQILEHGKILYERPK